MKFIATIILALASSQALAGGPFVVSGGDKTYLVDRYGNAQSFSSASVSVEIYIGPVGGMSHDRVIANDYGPGYKNDSCAKSGDYCDKVKPNPTLSYGRPLPLDMTSTNPWFR
jgi:hypothetical protein